MAELLLSLWNFLEAGWDVLVSLAAVLLPWLPLAAWIAFWLFAVNWIRLRDILFRGGLIGVLLIGALAVLIWGVIAPPADGVHRLFGLSVGNFVGKFVYVTALVCLAWLCGAVQLSGLLGDRGFDDDGPEMTSLGSHDHGSPEHLPVH